MDNIKDPKTWMAFEKYCEWLSLPRHYSSFTPEQLEEKGFNTELCELLTIKYKKDFAVKFCVSGEMLTEWDKHPELQAKIKKNWKKWTKNLTPGIMGKFYQKLMDEGDAQRMKLWMQIVEEEEVKDGNTNLTIGFANMLKSLKEDGELEDKTNAK